MEKVADVPFSMQIVGSFTQLFCVFTATAIPLFVHGDHILTIFIAICIDYLIYRFADELGLQHNSGTLFSLLITFWFVINEILSILENIGRMGVELPNFLKNILTELKNGVNNKDL